MNDNNRLAVRVAALLDVQNMAGTHIEPYLAERHERRIEFEMVERPHGSRLCGDFGLSFISQTGTSRLRVLAQLLEYDA